MPLSAPRVGTGYVGHFQSLAALSAKYNPLDYAGRSATVEFQLNGATAVATYTCNGQYWYQEQDPSSVAITGGTIGPNVTMRPTVLMHDDFTALADGALAASMPSGQAYNNVYTLDANRLRIVSGRLTNVTTAVSQAAGYAEVQSALPVKRIGASFGFGAKTTTNGSATLAIWSNSYIGSGAVPDGPCHLSISTDHWTYSVYQGGTQVDLLTGLFATELATDGTLYRAEVSIDGNTATVLLPDGSLVRVTDTRIGQDANWAIWEVFQSNPSTDAKAKFARIYADDSVSQQRDGKFPSRAEVLAACTALVNSYLPTRMYYSPGVANNLTVTTTMATLDSTNLALTFIAPPSGQVVIQVQANLLCTTRVLFALEWTASAGVSLSGSGHDVVGAGYDGVVNYTYPWTGLTPGRSYTVNLRAQSITSTATLRCDSANGRPFVMTATPF